MFSSKPSLPNTRITQFGRAMANLWPKHSQGVEGKKNWAASPLKHNIYPIHKISSIEGHNQTQPMPFSWPPSKENNQIGKVPTSFSVWDQVLDPSTLQKMEVFGSSSSFLFLSFLLSFLVSFLTLVHELTCPAAIPLSSP